MADYARLLISKILYDRDLPSTLDAGVKTHWFEDNEHRRAFAWLKEYFGRYGKTATVQAFRREFPTYRLIRVEEPYEYYTDKFKNLRERCILVDTVIDVDAQLKEGDHSAAQVSMSKGLMLLGQETSVLTDEDAIVNLKDRYDRYRANKKNHGTLVGIPTGFPTLDMVTSGYQPEQFILFGGQMKQCKSFTLMRSAIAAQEYNKKVLFFTFEMSAYEQFCRYDGIVSRVNATHLLHGTLDEDEFRRLRKGLSLRKNLPSFIISSDISGSTTMSGMAAKIEQYQPDIVFIDGVYLMENEIGAQALSPQAYTAISRGVKRLAQRTKKPVVASTQVSPQKVGKGGEIGLGSFMWSNAWTQDADLIMGVEKEETERTDGCLIRLRTVAGRNVAPRVINLSVNWDESSFEEVEYHDVESDD